jgi:hypothetical protein
MASQMNPETDLERENKALKLAYDRGRREQQVDSRLEGHDRHLKVINGSIERGARATERVEDKVDALAAQIATEGAVGKALARQATEAIRGSVSKREARVAAGVLGAMLFGTFVTALIAVVGH